MGHFSAAVDTAGAASLRHHIFLGLVDCQRCDRGIVELAQRVIAQDPDRIAKELHAAHNEPGVIDPGGYRGDKS